MFELSRLQVASGDSITDASTKHDISTYGYNYYR